MLAKRIFSAAVSLLVLSACTFVCSADSEEVEGVAAAYDFFTDFEEYNNDYEALQVWRKPVTEAVDASGQRKVMVPYIGGNSEFSANAAWSIGMLSEDTNPFLSINRYPEEIDPLGLFAPENKNLNSGSKSGYTELDKEKFTFGGLSDGSSTIGYIGYLSNLTVKYEGDGQDVESLMVTGSTNKELALAPYSMGTYKINDKSYDTAYFGHIADLSERDSYMTAKLRFTDSGEDLKLHIVQNGQWATLKSTLPSISDSKMQYCGNYDKGNWYDAVSFSGGDIYIGTKKIGTYEGEETYVIEYYTSLSSAENSTHTLVVKDDEGNIVASSKKEQMGFEQSLLGYDTSKAAYLTPYKNHGQITEFTNNDEYALVFSNSKGKVYIDDFGFGEGEPLKCNTQKDYYIKNPIRFLNSPKITLQFNYNIAEENPAELIEVKTADGKDVSFSAQVAENEENTLEITFETLSAASNYTVTVLSGLSSDMYVLKEDIPFVVRTMDNLTVGEPVVTAVGEGIYKLDIDITNASADRQKLVVVTAVKKNGVLAVNELYYSAASIATDTPKTVTVNNIQIPDTDCYTETYIIDNFGTLRALGDSKIIN